MFTETEMARAYREIGVRDPAFDMPAFLRQIKADVPTIIHAYLEGEIDVLKVPVPTITSVDGHPPAPCHASGIDGCVFCMYSLVELLDLMMLRVLLLAGALFARDGRAVDGHHPCTAGPGVQLLPAHTT